MRPEGHDDEEHVPGHDKGVELHRSALGRRRTHLSAQSDAEQAFTEAKARIADRIGQTYVTRTVCAQLGIKPHDKSNIGSRWIAIGGPGSASIKVQDGGSVKIEIRSIPVALALQVVAVLEAAAKATESEAA